MSNRSIANNLMAIFETFRVGRVTATNVEDAVERAVQAMENVSQHDIHRSRDLTHRLVEAALDDDSESGSHGPGVTHALESLCNHVAALGSQ